MVVNIQNKWFCSGVRYWLKYLFVLLCFVSRRSFKWQIRHCLLETLWSGGWSVQKFFKKLKKGVRNRLTGVWRMCYKGA